jgi:hypothetical protein
MCVPARPGVGMMGAVVHLSEYLSEPEQRPAVVADACALIDREVARTSGVSGLAIRSAYRVMSGLRPGMVASAVDSLISPFSDQLDPFYQEHVATGEPLEAILVAQRTSMADALLSITDDRADRSGNRTLRRAYLKVRGTARQHVEAAAPGIAGLVSAHAPGPGDTSG